MMDTQPRHSHRNHLCIRPRTPPFDNRMHTLYPSTLCRSCHRCSGSHTGIQSTLTHSRRRCNQHHNRPPRMIVQRWLQSLPRHSFHPCTLGHNLHHCMQLRTECRSNTERISHRCRRRHIRSLRNLRRSKRWRTLWHTSRRCNEPHTMHRHNQLRTNRSSIQSMLAHSCLQQRRSALKPNQSGPHC